VLILEEKQKLEKQIDAIQEYIHGMKKIEKGWVYNSHSAEQLQERKDLEDRMNELRKHSLDREHCLQQALLHVGVTHKNPISTLQPGTVEELVANYEKTHKSSQ